MATIREKEKGQWHAQVRRTGWPPVTDTLRTGKKAEEWARDVESKMDRGVFVDRSAAERTPFGETIKTYIKEVTEKRPGEASRAAEKSRLERFMRDEPKLPDEPTAAAPASPSTEERRISRHIPASHALTGQLLRLQ